MLFPLLRPCIYLYLVKSHKPKKNCHILTPAYIRLVLLTRALLTTARNAHLPPRTQSKRLDCCCRPSPCATSPPSCRDLSCLYHTLLPSWSIQRLCCILFCR